MVAQLLAGVRGALGLSVPGLAAQLQTSAGVIQALELGRLESLPPWPETRRLVDAWLALAGLDPRPALAGLDQAYETVGGAMPVSLRATAAIAAPEPSSSPKSGLGKLAGGVVGRGQQRQRDVAEVRTNSTGRHSLERIPIQRNRISALGFWFGRIFCDEPASTSSENALGPAKQSAHVMAAQERRTGGITAPIDGAETRRTGGVLRRLMSVRKPLFSLSVGLPPAWPARTLALILILAVLGTTASQTQVIAGAVAKLPVPAERAFRSLTDFFAMRFAPVRDGHRWIDVSDPRSRRGDKLRIGQHSD
ncbi:MAG: hypothetical protein KDJ45_12840 [Hyphomicrobiaceae bacterium]|nr:hypothetical protein [Hyphomicrobiaceae bacterium]